MLAHEVLESPIGALLLIADDAGLTEIRMAPFEAPAEALNPAHPILAAARAQLGAYFAGERQTFELPLAPAGSAFQRSVWTALQQVPYGTTIGYGEQARRLGSPTAARAVGAANGRNPLPIVIPCHRVIGAGGALTGYSGGLWRKEWLLRHEGALLL